VDYTEIFFIFGVKFVKFQFLGYNRENFYGLTISLYEVLDPT